VSAGLHVEARGEVVVATIDRPRVRNALDVATLQALADLLTVADGTRVVVLTATGDESFCAGMDLTAVRGAPPEELRACVAALDDALDSAARVPVIAALNGPATGGGFEIALRCDLVVAAEHASLRLPEVQHGMVPGGGGTLLPTRIPLAAALELGMVGDAITAARGYELGIVNRVVPAQQVLGVALALAARIAANGPLAVRHVRALMHRATLEGASSAMSATRAVLRDPALRAEMQEGIAAFFEKRRPRW
jgi:enoyl-CoA hydratase/carnithine racemase